MAQTVDKPKVTVLMPVFNGEKYLAEAIESILKQTFRDFEFLIINDGSTDKSVSIIESFKDSRICFISNAQNIGLIDTLNKAVGLAKGEYVARMDCDDISMPERMEKQVRFLDANPDACVVASHVKFINADGEETGYWDTDIKTKSREEIYAALPKDNCIAHPTVLIRKTILSNYLYRNAQKNSEDWDIWLRMAADGQRIEKINEVLLKYRIHFESVTMIQNSPKASQKKVVKFKRRFLAYQLSKFKINTFFFAVFYSWLRGIARYWRLYIIQDALRNLKRILTSNPFKIYANFIRLKKYLSTHTHNLIFFFPYTHVGGAERVHSDIVECVKDKSPLVFFTGFSQNNSFLPRFEKNANVFDIPGILNYPFTKVRAKKIIAGYINAQANIKIMGCNSIFYYELLNLLTPDVYCIDLKHSFIYPDNGAEKALLLPMMRLNKRIFISRIAMEKNSKFYHENNIPKLFAERLQYIPNFIPVPDSYKEKTPGGKLNVIYVGRGTPEKRVHLVAQIASDCHNKGITASFKMVGSFGNAVDKSDYPYINFTGEITDEYQLNEIYRNADILLITSSTEGFPMAIMEAMANGVVPISTDVGDAPLHITNYKNGFVTSANDEEKVVSEITSFIRTLTEDREMLKSISENAYEYAKENFSRTNFCNSYRALLST